MRSRPGSLKSKSQYQKIRENGDVSAAVASERKLDEFDIKILQQKRHEAEVKRSLQAHVISCRELCISCV